MLLSRRLLAAALLAGLPLTFGLSHVASGSGPRATSSGLTGPEVLVARKSYRGPNLPSVDLIAGGPTGSPRHLVYGGPGDGIDPVGYLSWFPDGNWIAFSGSKGLREGDLDIYLIPGDGGKARRVTRLGDAVAPVIAPGGRWMAFSRVRFTDHFYGFSLWRVRTDGTRLHQITPWRNSVLDFPGSFSPSGKRIAYTRIACHSDEHCDFLIRTKGLKGSKGRLLARRAWLPSYSPDGSQIAFGSFRDANGSQSADGEVTPNAELYVMRADGSSLRRLTHTSATSESFPSWDPSGSRIAYEVERRGQSTTVAQINSDGTCPRRLIPNSGVPLHDVDFANPAWRPGPDRGAGPIVC